MKLLKKLWELSDTEKGSCRIMSATCTGLTTINIAFELAAPTFVGILIGINTMMWIMTELIEDDDNV